MTDAPLPIALTMGEPAGIGGELSIKAWYRHRRNLTPFYLLDDPDRITALSEAMGTPIAAGVISEPAEAAAIFPDRLPVLPVSLSAPVVSGQLNAANIAAVQTSIEIAVRHVEDGNAAAMVTNPIHKEALYNAGFAHPGHTEFLAALAGLQSEPVMMLATEALRVATVTRHISLANALKRLSPELIIETVATVHLSLCRDFAVPNPRIAVAALNPHGGEQGLFGTDEMQVIGPALVEAQRRGWRVTGPVPADSVFNQCLEGRYDGVLSLYHDQGHIAAKTLDFHGTVSLTMGLKFLRTSVDHGTAFDIAGRGIADERGMVAALRSAGEYAAAVRERVDLPLEG